jgi:hypothetical protein
MQSCGAASRGIQSQLPLANYSAGFTLKAVKNEYFIQIL